MRGGRKQRRSREITSYPSQSKSWFRRLWASFSYVGLSVGTLFLCASLSPSLLPRNYVVQGLLSGIALAVGYGLGVLLVWLWKFLDLPPIHGAMRELLAWPADSVYPLPSSIDVIEAPLIEPLCVAIHALELAPDVKGRAVLITGCGAIGLFTLQMAKVRGAAKVLVSDRVPERLAVAAKLGADALIRIGEDDPAEVSFAATEGRGVDVSFEAAGPPEALQQCLDAVRPKGEVVVIGIPSEDTYHLRASELRRRELSVRFVRRQRENYDEALRLVDEGRVALRPLLTHRFPFDLSQQAFDLAERKEDGAIRVAVLP